MAENIQRLLPHSEIRQDKDVIFDASFHEVFGEPSEAFHSPDVSGSFQGFFVGRVRCQADRSVICDQKVEPFEITILRQHSSRFTLELLANRHLDYYAIRILIPIARIVTVSWFTFFLKDYLQRIDFSGTKLLLFIAFNFTVSHDLPRLGYLTLIDVVMVCTFIITGLAILLNVILRHLETSGKGAVARRLDVFAIIGYPLAYIIGAANLAFWMQ